MIAHIPFTGQSGFILSHPYQARTCHKKNFYIYFPTSHLGFFSSFCLQFCFQWEQEHNLVHSLFPFQQTSDVQALQEKPLIKSYSYQLHTVCYEW